MFVRGGTIMRLVVRTEVRSMAFDLQVWHVKVYFCEGLVLLMLLRNYLPPVLGPTAGQARKPQPSTPPKARSGL